MTAMSASLADLFGIKSVSKRYSVASPMLVLGFTAGRTTLFECYLTCQWLAPTELGEPHHLLKD